MIRFFFSAILLFLFFSCKKEGALNPIDSDILVSSRFEGTKVFIDCETEKVYGCPQPIDYEIFRQNNRFTIKFLRIGDPGVCEAVMSPAFCFIDLGSLLQGEYTIDFELNKQVSTGVLIVDSTTELTLITSGNIRLK